MLSNQEHYIKREDLKKLSEIHNVSEISIKSCLIETSRITNYSIDKVIQLLYNEHQQSSTIIQHIILPPNTTSNVSSNTSINTLSFNTTPKSPIKYRAPHFKRNDTLMSSDKSNIESPKNLGHFTDGNLDVNVDDQLTVVVPFNKQEYMNRDFTKIVHSRFPRLTDSSYRSRKFGWKPYWAIQRDIDNSLKEGVNWTNQTLSYARTEIVGKHMISCIINPLVDQNLFGENIINVVDATSNIGADSITFGLEYFVNKVYSYEIYEPSFKMLQNNIKLYKLEDRIFPINKRFDYDITRLNNALVVIDPPYESSYNTTLSNFNLSIDTTPIHNVAQKCLDAGARCVLLSMPKTYKYNRTFAEHYDQHVTAYQMGKKNNKLFLVMRNEDGLRLNLPQFKFYRIVSAGTKNYDGTNNPYKCKKI